MGNKINVDIWKNKLNPDPDSPCISVVSLFDLFFYEDKGKVGLRVESIGSNNFTIKKGLPLDHDIIAFYSPMYNPTNGALEINFENISNLWFDKGFDIAYPKYDSRAVKKFLEINNEDLFGNGLVAVNRKDVPKNRDVFKDVGEDTKRKDLFNQKLGYWIYDRESVLKYETVEIFTQNSITIKNSVYGKENLFQKGLVDTVDGVESINNSKFLSVFGNQSDTSTLSAAKTSTGSEVISADVFVVDTDEIFEETMSTTNQNSPHLLFAVGHTERSVRLILESLGLSVPQIPNPTEFFTLLNNYVQIALTNGTEDSEKFLLALKNNYALIRCSFFADYVDPDDFNQNLEQTSNVEFGNLYIKNSSGDFYRYDTTAPGMTSQEVSGIETSIMDNHRAILTRAFMPQTSPIVDLASEAIYKEGIDHKELKNYKTPGTEEEGVKGTIKEKFIRLVDSSDWPNTPIGSIYVEPISKESQKSIDQLSELNSESVVDQNDRLKNIGNPSYFDPESRKDAEDYTLEEWERLPTLIHKKGNIQIDGRLLSVTTDELWTAIKKIILGRRPDVDPTSIDLVDEGIPFNSDIVKSNDKDTRLFEVTNNEFKFLYDKDEQSKKGDPIRVSIAPNENNKESLIVEMFVNNNDSIKYTIYEAIHRLDKSVVRWDKTSNNIEEKHRSVRKFTPWKINVRTSEEVENVPENGLDTGDEWKPRKVPFSLRELEAGVLQNKYNIISLARYLKENFMVSGQLGRVIVNKMPYGTEDNVIEHNSAGSLYQSHKDYNYVVDNPNTYFDFNRENKIDDVLSEDRLLYRGRGAIFSDGDYRGLIEYKTDDFNSRYDESVYSTGQRYHSINGYEPSEVYMAADGTWRYIHDHVRSPILKTKY